MPLIIEWKSPEDPFAKKRSLMLAMKTVYFEEAKDEEDDDAQDQAVAVFNLFWKLANGYARAGTATLPVTKISKGTDSCKEIAQELQDEMEKHLRKWVLRRPKELPEFFDIINPILLDSINSSTVRKLKHSCKIKTRIVPVEVSSDTFSLTPGKEYINKEKIQAAIDNQVTTV